MSQFPKSNPSLNKAITIFNKQKTTEYRKNVYRTLKNGPLLVAVDSIPQGYLFNQIADAKHIINMLAIRTLNGSFMLVAFTDEQAVFDYEPGLYILMESYGLLEIVQKQYGAGIMINPADQKFNITQNEIEEILKNWNNN